MQMSKTPTRFEYLLSGRDGSGRRVTEIVQAVSADAALRLFEEQGRSDIVLHTDDMVAPFFQPSKLGKHYRPSECVRLRTAGPIAYVAIVSVSMYRHLWVVGILLIALLASRRLIGSDWDFLDAIAVFGLFIPVWVAIYFAATGPLRIERRLLKAIGWARWEDVLRLVGRLDRQRYPEFQLRLRKAQALAGLGRLSEALTEFDQVDDLPDIPRSAYWIGQAAIYMAARETDRVLAVLERACELNPAATLPVIDFANKLLVFRRDAKRARQVLAQAREHAIADTAYPWLLATEGLLSLHDRRPAEAVERLSEALRQFRPFMRGNPSVAPLLARIRAWLCLAHAEVGDTATARSLMRWAAALLVAHREDDLLRQCEQAVG
jgi:tetratricopeptide (TPR) repeat protein